MPSLKKVQRFGTNNKANPKGWTNDNDGFYQSAPWRWIRKAIIKETPYCVPCDLKGKSVPATVVDHTKPRRFWPELELERTNLVPHCRTCHNSKSAHEKNIHSKADWLIKAKELDWL